MQTLIIWAIIFLFTALKVSQTARGKDTFIAYALIACICALASAYLTKAFVMVLYIAGISLIAYIFHKGGKK